MTNSDDRREFLRIDYETPVQYKIYTGERLLKKPDVLSKNISASGLLFRTDSDTAIPAIGNIVWIELDEKMLNICHEIENDLLLRDSGIFARVVRISEGEPDRSYDIGVCFLRRKNLDDSQIEMLFN